MHTTRTIWQGVPPSATVQDGLTGRHKATAAFWLVLFVAVAAARFLFPFHETDVMTTHLRVVDSILAGHNWGRQALVGSLEFPPLPTLGLLLANPVADYLKIGPEKLLVAVCQGWAWLYLIRMPLRASRRFTVAILFLLLLLMPDWREALFALDPNWIGLVFVCSTAYHLMRWHDTRSLRDAVIAAINCGLLVFSGLTGLAFSLSVLGVMTHDLCRFSELEEEDISGIRLLLWVPAVYCFALWIIWNWLVMGNMLFLFRQLWYAILSLRAADLAQVLHFWADLSLFGLCGLITLALCLHTRVHIAATCIMGGLGAVLVMRIALRLLTMLSPGGALVTLVLGTIGVLLPLMFLQLPAEHWRSVTWVFVCMALVTGGLVRSGQAYASSQSYMEGAPEAREVFAWIDRFWPDSRIVIHGIRAPAVFHDLSEERFVARLDFHPSRFLDQAEDEQLHLMVPPADGRYYSAHAGPLSDIHANGKPWLLLEKQWESGWQLWRCVIPPEGKSRLISSPSRYE